MLSYFINISFFFKKKTDVVRSFNHCLAPKTLKLTNFETSYSHPSHLNAFTLSFATSCDTKTSSPSALQPLVVLQHHVGVTHDAATSLSLSRFCNLSVGDKRLGFFSFLCVSLLCSPSRAVI